MEGETMKVIFIRDLKGQGKKGEVKEVKDGYGNNFLIKNGYAVLASSGNMTKLKNEEARRGIEETLKVHDMEDIKKELGNINCVIAKELTKIHETFIRGSIEKVLEEIDEPKGEYIILLDMSRNKVIEEEAIENKSVEEQYQIYEKQGMSKKEIIKQIAKNKKVNKNEIYQMFIEEK